MDCCAVFRIFCQDRLHSLKRFSGLCDLPLPESSRYEHLQGSQESRVVRRIDLLKYVECALGKHFGLAQPSGDGESTCDIVQGQPRAQRFNVPVAVRRWAGKRDFSIQETSALQQGDNRMHQVRTRATQRHLRSRCLLGRVRSRAS